MLVGNKNCADAANVNADAIKCFGGTFCRNADVYKYASVGLTYIAAVAAAGGEK
jgi:hypothetical protein